MVRTQNRDSSNETTQSSDETTTFRAWPARGAALQLLRRRRWKPTKARFLSARPVTPQPAKPQTQTFPGHFERTGP